jgi:hypothetical protein
MPPRVAAAPVSGKVASSSVSGDALGVGVSPPPPIPPPASVDGLGLGVFEAVGLGEGFGVALRVGLGVGLLDGLALGQGVGEGVGQGHDVCVPAMAVPLPEVSASTAAIGSAASKLVVTR